MDLQKEEVYALIDSLSISAKEKLDLKKLYEDEKIEDFILKIQPLLDSEKVLIDAEIAKLDTIGTEEKKYLAESEKVETELDGAFDELYRLRVEEPEAQIQQIDRETREEFQKIDRETQQKLKDLEKEFRVKIDNAEIDKVKDDLRKL